MRPALETLEARLTPTTYTPTTFSDLTFTSVDPNTGVITGGTGNGQITLRSAVIAANAHAGADTISLAAGTYQLSIAPVMSGTFGSGNFHKSAYDNGTGFALNGSLDVTDDLTVTGAGQAQTIIDGGNQDVIFSINPFIVSTNNSAKTGGLAASLSNLTLQHGNNPSDDGVNGFAAGGAIWWEGGWLNGVAQDSGSLSLDHVTVDHNTTHGGGGGLVVYNGGTVSITNSTFSNNTATGDSVFAGADGGGIIVTNTQGNGTVTISNTDITGNTCTPFGQGGGAGGGLEVVGGLKPYSVAIHGGSIKNNSAPSGGGIVELGGNVPSFTIDGGTVISGNTANGTSSFAGSGGGVAAFGNITIGAGTVISGNQTNGSGGGVLIGGGSSITQASIVNNTAGVTGGGVYIFGGPDVSANEAAASVSFSRIVGNTASLGPKQIDNANVPSSLTDNWLGVNLPGPNDVGSSNAVPISSIGPATPGSSATVTTALPHGFFSGQMLSINGVANNVYDGTAGFNGQQAPTPGVSVTGPTAFTFVWPAGDAMQLASSGGYVNQTWPIQTAMESGSTVTLIGMTVPHNIGSGDAGDSTVRPGGNTPNLAVGQVVQVSGIPNAGYDGVFVITAVGTPNSHSFSYTATQTGLPTINDFSLDNGKQIGSAIPLAKNVSTLSESGSTVTVNTSGAHGLAVGNVVRISGVGATGYNGTFVVSSVTTTSFTYTNTVTGLASSSGGNVSKLEDSALQLTAGAGTTSLVAGNSTAVTASFLTDSAGNPVSTSNLAREVGLPVSFAATGGSISGAQATIQNGGTATASFGATVAGHDSASATVDNQTSTVAITVQPAVTPSTAALPANSTSITIVGVGFDPTAGNNVVAFNNGATGTVTAATNTQLTVTGLTGLVSGSLTAVVTTNGISSGAAVQVATVTPVVTSSTAGLPANATSMTINGFGFSPTASNNTVAFSGTATGTVTAATRTQLTVTGLSGLTVGNLTATVTSNGQGSGAAVQVATVVPVVTASTANLPANSTSLTIAGFGFDPTAANDTVSFSGGVAGTVTAATATQLTVGNLSGLVGGALDASVKVDNVSSGPAVQVATVTPVVTASTASLPANATSIVINGFGFDPTAANDSVAFNDGAAGTVTAASATSLTVTFSTRPVTAGSLTAVVTTNNASSGPAVQVATVTPVVTASTASLPATATTLTITGFGFDPTAANDVVSFSGGVTGTVTAATATQLTVSGLAGLVGGALDASVKVDNVSSGPAVQVATVVPVVTASTASLPANATTLTIAGFGFDPTAANDSVAFNDGAAGSVTAASATSLTVTFSTRPTSAGVLTAAVTTNGVSGGPAVQAATVTPVVTMSVTQIQTTAPTITINGFGFDSSNANNSVAFNLGAAGSVTSSNPTRLVVTFSTQPSVGNLTAVVTSNTVSSGAPVQVAKVIALVNTGLSLGEGTTATITSAMLAAQTGAPAASIVYTVTSAPTHGTLKLSGTALAVNGTFTQDDVNTGKVTYTQDGTDNNDSFAFSVSDSTGPAATGTFNIAFTEAAAVITANTGASVPEGMTTTLTGAQLAAGADPVDPPAELVYTLTAAPAHGTLKVNGSALAVNGTFTQDDLNTGKVTYTQDGTDNNDSFAFSVADSPGAAATGTFNIAFTEAAAAITANTGLSVDPGATVTLTGSQLAAGADPVDPAAELVYTLTAAPAHGTLKLGGAPLAVNGTFTQDDINTGKVTYTQDGTNNSDGFAFSVADSPGGAASGTVTITPLRADLAVTKTAPANVAPGTNFSYTLTVTNNGPGTARNVVLADPLPAGVNFVSQSQTSGPAFVLGTSGNQIRDTIASLAGGASATFTVVANAPVPGAVTNTATVSNSVIDPVLSNNVASAATAIGTPSDRWLAQVYLDVLHRAVDSLGLAYWTGLLDAGLASRTLVALAIENSPEGQLARVNDLYLQLFGRPADPLGLFTWVPFLQRGGTTEQLKAILMGSPEYYLRRGGGNDAGFAAALFKDVLGETLDPFSRSVVTGALARGMNRTEMALSLLQSPSAALVLVDGFYPHFLRRRAESNGLYFFATALSSGVSDEVVMAVIQGSPEYVADFAG